MNQNAIDLDKVSYKISMIKFVTEAGHADFIFKVVGPSGVSFLIKDRYSSMRQF